MKSKKSFLLFFLSVVSTASYAVCPLCTVFVGTGVGLSQWLGIDDVISGLWIGGLTMSLVIWTVAWLDQRHIRFKGRKLLVLMACYVFLIMPLYMGNLAGHPLNRLWGIDKLMLGIVIGSIIFFLGYVGYMLIKQYRGQAHFPFQKVVMPVLPLIICTVIFHFIV
jgi:hypothetical protein